MTKRKTTASEYDETVGKLIKIGNKENKNPIQDS